jgi:hypothetical protein
MRKKTNLVDALHEASGKKRAVSILPKSDKNISSVLNGKPPSRVGKKVIAGHFDQAVIRQLKMLALNNDSSIQSMLTEALNDLFEKYNMKPIA